MDTSLIDLRRTLHQFPELSGQEQDTAQRILSYVGHEGPSQIIEELGGHGLALVYAFKNSGPTIAIRCELDALPIQEINDFEYQSTIDGVSHKCGHDGHMTIVAGLAKWITTQGFDKGSIVLLFQPAEETGRGAEAVLKDPRFEALGIDYMFALHNIPKVPLHEIIVMDRGFSAEVISFNLELQGKASHAAEPEHGINPAIAIAELISSFSKLNIA